MGLDPWLEAALFGLLGLLIGSFLNVVIHRLPRMMERQWATECAEYVRSQDTAAGKGAAPSPEPAQPEPFNLWTPRSRCPACGHVVKWHENIPVLGYLRLGGKCSSCKTRISPRYPAVEMATGALFAFCAWRWGATGPGLAWCGFSAALLALAFIDWDTTLLPDDITLPLLWAGLLGSAFHLTTVPLFSSVMGATGGYLSLWAIYWAFKLATGKEGMGYGDFKLFAALGAWFGWQALVPIILMASVIGAVVGIGMKLFNGLREGGYIPFGPFLVGAGLTAMVFGPDTVLRAILGTLGL
ncbi:prepilin peptidase [Paracidovorax anthurii]|uniref:Prepilin leader peptidase/N-methyltransferase n=1 Tax=Paracidovorax anthurii TaxID=78229 RepID=A0A328ZFU6_9BURK|nr:A24 family peptidase [Paracidovorax anthurii]RAR84235.1 type 4 prepilin peptidase 1 [Paracidovorax anthurii]